VEVGSVRAYKAWARKTISKALPKVPGELSQPVCCTSKGKGRPHLRRKTIYHLAFQSNSTLPVFSGRESANVYNVRRTLHDRPKGQKKTYTRSTIPFSAKIENVVRLSREKCGGQIRSTTLGIFPALLHLFALISPLKGGWCRKEWVHHTPTLHTDW
jgi:hypothetical protein